MWYIKAAFCIDLFWRLPVWYYQWTEMFFVQLQFETNPSWWLCIPFVGVIHYIYSAHFAFFFIAGLVIRPNSLDIAFNKSDQSKYSQYVNHLESFLQSKCTSPWRWINTKTDSILLLPDRFPMLRFYFSGCISVCLSGYNDTEQEKNEECNPGEYFLQEDSNDMSKKACRFKRGFLSLCSGLSDTTFGYSDGKPCVLLKMNRVKTFFIEQLQFKMAFRPFLPSQRAPNPWSLSIILVACWQFPKLWLTWSTSTFESFNLSCLPSLTDHRPQASRRSLHQLHSQSKHIFPHNTAHVPLACMCIVFFSFPS